ncbi:hypothetical protein DD681_00130 [Buchnera aphidicola (Melanaphis sacchari)]|uniref:Uncharacterized protein n=1 Tax=Buchnera aphidicola (Melanaphis sacchari) TaxID=2173854 RepID=A0A2U8DG43_9GAMM|nr:hypothetical protein [Buchnera aphidicola]AWH90244.1 hypothetical protein DD681_00130 [Buchnera aphidicola (Melanaphis sacchari)]
MQRVKELKETIKSSKIFIHTIIEKIRDTGKIKIVNKLNNNPLHPEYQSTFPDLHLASNKIDNSNQSYLSSLNEQFDLENKNNIINRYLINKIDNNFKKSSIPIDIPEKIKEKIKLFFEKSKPVNEINQDFMEDFHSSLFIVDGNLIYSTNKEDMIREFKKIVPNIEDRKFISTYARPKLLNKSYFELISEHPELNEYRITNSRNIYEINHLKDGTLQLIVTNLSDISPTDDNSIKRYCAFGVRASAILSPESNSPIMEYSHFLN